MTSFAIHDIEVPTSIPSPRAKVNTVARFTGCLATQTPHVPGYTFQRHELGEMLQHAHLNRSTQIKLPLQICVIP